MQVVSLVTAPLLPHVRVLARSLREHHPDWQLEILLVSGDVTAAQRDGFPVRPLAEELDLPLADIAMGREPEELLTRLVPLVLQEYCRRGTGPVLHLPPTCWVLGPLDPMLNALSGASVLLLPRLDEDLPDDGLQPTSVELEQAGRVSPLVIGVSGDPQSSTFLSWWHGRMEEALGPLEGEATRAVEDRRWAAKHLELAPSRFAATLLDDPGCNLSLWNLHQRHLERTEAGYAVEGGAPVRFLDLVGFAPDRPFRLAPNATRIRLTRAPVLGELVKRYTRELRVEGWRDDDGRGEVGRQLAPGVVFDDRLRLLLAQGLALGEDFGDVFSAQGRDAFMAWLRGPARYGAAAGVSRYLYRIYRQRPDLRAAYPDLDGPGGEGFTGWCWVYGRPELGIPDAFLPPRPSHIDVPDPQDAEDVVVRISGYFSHTLGLGAAARGYVRALSAVGVAVVTASVPLNQIDPLGALGAEYGRAAHEELVHDAEHAFDLIAVNADELPAFVNRVGADYFAGRRIGIWGWETNSIPDRWQEVFQLVDEIWVYSRFMAENLGRAAPVPVVSLPPPVVAASSDRRLRLDVPDGFLFLFMFDYLSTLQRKNPVGLVRAFKLAFAPDEGPRLLIKTINGPLRPLAEEELLWECDGRSDIHVVDRSLSGEEKDALIATCDCYVSLHRAEGFGLTLAEAMAVGKPVIGTAYSGNTDFMTPANSYLVDYSVTRVGSECEIYPADGEWAEPNLEHAAELMRAVFVDRESAARIGDRARRDIAQRLSLEATGRPMLERLQRLSRTG